MALAKICSSSAQRTGPTDMLSDIAEELTARIKAMRAQDDQKYNILNVSAARIPRSLKDLH